MRQFRAWIITVLLIAGAVAPFFEIASAQAQSATQTLLNQAEEARRGRRFFEAEQLFKRVLQGQPAPRVQAQAMNGLTHVQFNLNRIDESERSNEAARAFIQKNFAADDLLMASAWQAYALIRLQKYRDRAGAQEAIEKVSAIRNAKIDVWETINDGTALRYKPIGFVMPMQSGALKQINRAIHDDAGTDVSANYDAMLPSGNTLRVTVYAYRLSPGLTPDASFRQEIEGVQAFNRTARMVRNDTFPVDMKGRLTIGRRALFQYAGQGVTVDTRLYMVFFGDWAIKLRVTGNVDDEAAVEQELDGLLRALVWPQ